ncbi:hypothetical protein C5167_032778 [Papaver somniferum]|uniref:Uncharacterized protein n=1 Tax=Papaver somniferum TaxID=3469 RepID=A0A4Y7KA15_PAPSO|nr:hypothetical protein C5167_032778 [Papaver somniferum]
MNIDGSEEKVQTVIEEEEDIRKSKRSREAEILNGDMAIDQIDMSSHINPIFQRDLNMIDGTDSTGEQNGEFGKQSMQLVSLESKRENIAFDSSGDNTSGGATQNQPGMAANQSKILTLVP